MKKVLFYIAAIVAITFAFSGCQKIANSEAESSTIVCRTPSETKSYADVLNVLWQDEDIIYVLDRYAPTKPSTYTLATGAGTKEATFIGSGFDDDQDIVAFHFNYYGTVGGKFYYDMPHTPTLYGYDATTPASGNTMRIPMMAIGKMGEPLEFTHLASMVRISLTNALGADVTITGISLEVDSNDIGARVEVNPADWSTRIYSAFGCTNITSAGSVEIKDTKTKTFDFIVQPKVYSEFTVLIETSSGDQYRYRKNPFTASVGTVHTFNTTLSSSAILRADYRISIDNNPAVEYDATSAFPVTPESSIKVLPNAKTAINAADFAAFISHLPSEEIITVDLSEMDYSSTTWNAPFGNSSIGDFYLPKNVTRLGSSYMLGGGAANCKLHITKKITYIHYPVFKLNAGTLFMEDGCGFFVDDDNTSFSSSGGSLYSKKGYMLLDRPGFKSDASGIDLTDKVTLTTVNTYSLSNANYTSVVFPSSLTGFGSLVLYNTKLLKTITFKSVTPPSGLAANVSYLTPVEAPAVGQIIIDTGDADQDLSAKSAYESVASTSLPAGWIIKTKAEPLPE